MPFKAPGVLLSFEGGNVAGNFVSVLGMLERNNITLPVKPRTLDKPTVCDVLIAENFPPPCGSLLPAIQALNSRVNLNKLRPGDVFNLPNISIYGYTASGQFALDDPKQFARSQDILKNWKRLDAVSAPRPGGSIAITYQAFQIVIPTRNDAAAQQLYEQLRPLSSPNLLLDRLLEEEQPARVYSNRPLASAELMSQACSDGTWNPVSYGDYVTGDPDAIEIVKASLPQARAKTPIWIIDGPLVPSPNLYPAFGTSPSPADWTWTCKWTPFSTGLHHANHMASIIASQGTKFGFVGLAPNVVIKPTPWLTTNNEGTSIKVPARFVILRQQIVANENGSPIPLRVYLMASSYDDSSTTPLPSPDARFIGAASKAIRDNHLLLIAAAGQKDSEHPAVIDLTNKSPISPMNLGDLEGVVIVTACMDCERATAQLMSDANYSSGYHKMVHIAAPGGRDIAGWINSDSIGAANGTSQAAAFAAGVAASMISAYPDTYALAKLVKRRLQVTSWPLPAGDGTAQADANKLAAGVIDPVLALLDPNKTWLKAGGWRSVAAKSLSVDPLPLTDGYQNPKLIKADAILRLMKIGDQFSVYTDRNLVGEGEVAEIGRLDGVSPPNKAVLVLCDGTQVKLSEIDDFIPAIQGFSDASSCR